VADVDLLERFDGHAALRNLLRDVAGDRELWAGIPLPLDGESLVVEPTYPNAQALMAMCGRKAEEDPISQKWRLRARFWSTHKSSEILILEDAEGRIDCGIVPGIHHLDYDLRTLGCADAWGIEQESNAVRTLASLVSHRQFKQYMLTGSFLESSKRSHVTYLFRRLKPTVAIAARGGKMKILCCLCQHPIAYYQGSWAGAMCPTDDVIAHLSLMRGDEALYWKRSTQHPAWRPEAGL